MKKTFLLLSLLLSALYSFGDIPYNAWWQKANTFYQQRNYDSAAFYYEQLSALKPEHAEVFYNLGNTYYRLNKIGAAVLNYERAIKLRPYYQEARDNLELTQSRIGNRIRQTPEIFFVAWWKQLTRPTLSGTWALLGLLTFLIMLTAVLLRKWHKGPGWVRSQLPVLTIFLCAGFMLLAYVASSRRLSDDRAVVMQHDVPLKDNVKASKTQVLIPEGTVVTVDGEQSGWAEVKLPDGRGGWVRKDALERI